VGKITINGQDARSKILKGILKVTNAVKVTYGPKGKLVAYYKGRSIATTKDGISVAKQLDFTDELENMGALLVKEAADKANHQNGDGSSLATILTGELCKEYNTLLNFNADINQIKESLEYAKDQVLKELETFKYELVSDLDIYDVARISANGDTEIAGYIQEAFNSIGNNGIVSLANSLSRSGKTEVVISSGLEFNKGYASSLSVTNLKSETCELNKPNILICGKHLSEYSDIVPIIDICRAHKESLVIIAPSFDELFIAAFNEVLRDHTLAGAVTTLPGMSQREKLDYAKDLAMLLGAKILYDEVDLSDFDPAKHMGSCELITLSKNKTAIIDAAAAESEEFKEYLVTLQNRITLDEADEGVSKYEIDALKERLANLDGGVATIRIGALNEITQGEKFDRYDDALNAVRAAISDGCIPGASTPLLRISYKLMNEWTNHWPLELNTLEKQSAATIFLKTLRKPAKFLIQSAGNDPENIIPEILSKGNAYGFDARGNKVDDLINKGGPRVIDSFKVIKNCVIYSVDMAKIFISLGLAVMSDVKNLSLQNLDSIMDGDHFGS
jgi:chaperonin GroEL